MFAINYQPAHVTALGSVVSARFTASCKLHETLRRGKDPLLCSHSKSFNADADPQDTLRLLYHWCNCGPLARTIKGHRTILRGLKLEDIPELPALEAAKIDVMPEAFPSIVNDSDEGAD